MAGLTLRVLNQTHKNSGVTPKVVWLISVAATCAHVAVACFHGGPVAVPDIPSYLHVAQVVAGVGESWGTQFHPGMGVILSPFALMGMGGSALHTTALIINGVAAGAVAVVSYRLAKALHAPHHVSLIVSGIAAVFPVLAVGSRTAWPEPLLALAVLGITTNLAAGTRNCRFWAGCIAASAVAFHPRALVFCGALVVALLLHRSRDATRNILAGLLTGSMFTAFTLVATSTWLWPRVSASLTGTALEQRVFAGIGQITALMGMTCGFALLAILFAWRHRKQVTPLAQAATFAVTGALAMSVLGGWVLGGGDRPDLVMYSRYVAPFGLPLTIIGLITAAKNTTRRPLWIWPVLGWAAISIGSGWFIDESDRTYRRIMTISNGWAWTAASGHARLALVLSVGLVVACLGVLIFQPRALMTVVGALITTCLISTVSNHHKLAEIGDIAQRQTQLHSAIPDMAECLSFDGNSTKTYLEWLYRIELPHMSFTTIDLQNGDQPCGTYVVAGASALRTCEGAAVQVSDPDTGWALWAYPTQGCD